MRYGTETVEASVFGRLSSAARFFAVVCAILLVTAASAVAQNRTLGEIRGTVTDQSQARIQGAVVDILNQETGVNTRLKTNSDGVYDAPSLVPGTYTVTVSREGFRTSIETGLLLRTEAITANATLGVGSATEKVTVEATTAQVETESAELRIDLNKIMAMELPNVGLGENTFLQLLPGIMPSGAINQGGQVAGTTARNGDDPAINGQNGGQQQWTMDGGTRTINGGGTWLAQAPIDAIDTVNYVIANFGAQYGNGLSSFNATTKSGTNHWHGTAYEFVQNDFFNARNYFSYVPPYVAPFKWNNFGGTVGGPIKKNKSFFFFSYQNNPTKSFSSSWFTFPTASMLAGDFSQVPGQDASGNSTGQPVPVYIPGTLTQDPVTLQYSRQPLPGNKMAGSGYQISPVSAAIQAWYPQPTFNNPTMPGQNPQACAATEGLLPVGCFAFNYYWPNGITINNFDVYNGKVDYDLRSNNRFEVSGMLTKNHNPQLNYFPFYPIRQNNQDLIQYTGQISDFWTATPNVVNEFRVAVNRFDGTFYSTDYRQGYAQKIGLTNDLGPCFPGVSITGPGGTSIANGSSHHVDSTYVPSDLVTWVKGKHILKIGGEFDELQIGGIWVNPEGFNFSGIATENPIAYDPSLPYTQGLGYADFLFGDVASWGSDIPVSTMGVARNAQVFVQDDYKIKKNLTLNIGVRYQAATAWGEKRDRISDFSPTLMNPGTGTLGAIVFGSGAVAAPHNLLFDPRLGFSYSPKNKWAIRGGYGIFHVQSQANNYGGNYGSGWDTQGSAYSPDNIHPAFQWNNGVPGYIIPTAATRTPDLYNGQGIGYVPHNQPLAYSQQWQVGVQHEIIGGFLLDVAYVGTRGTHLPFQRDMDQVPADLLFNYNPTTGTDMQPYRPYPQYYGINAILLDGFSMYNSLQVSVKKQFGQGLSLIANYTQSKNHDTMTTTVGASNDVWQNAYDVKANFATSATDVPYTINGGEVYKLPLGKGKQFLNHGGILDAVVGGWQVSSIWYLHSGITFTPTMFDNASGALSGSWEPIRVGDPMKAGPVAGNPGCTAPTQIHNMTTWFNPCAYVSPAAGTFGQNLRNSLRSPAYRRVDMSVAKSFRLPLLGEAAGLQIKMDTSDAFNHANFGVPNSCIGCSNTGMITSAQSSRSLQLGGRLTF